MSYKPEQFAPYMELGDEKFVLSQDKERLVDKKLDTQQVGYFKDAMRRFSRNRGSVICAWVILVLVLYAILAPIIGTYNGTEFDALYKYALPRNELCVKFGLNFWDGTKTVTVNQAKLDYYEALGAVVECSEPEYSVNEFGIETTSYRMRYDSYKSVGFTSYRLSMAQIDEIRAWEAETGIQVMYPIIDDSRVGNLGYKMNNDENAWFLMNGTGVAIRDENGALQDIYQRDENGEAVYYAEVQGGYEIRVYYPAYYQYINGHEASFLFGSDSSGYDIFSRLALGARLSLVLSVAVTCINLALGIVIGSLEGYFGGWFDLLFERVKDVLNQVPTVVLMSLFQIYFADKVGPVVSLFLCYIAFGWVGTSATVRAQIYRYKGQEYVLAARTLGAKDSRLIFRHILPNAAGFIITCSVLAIPGVIFSESNMTYLGIVNLQGTDTTSVGTMLANAKDVLASYPHCVFFPSLFIGVLLICFNIFGNGLRDAFNPSLRGAEE